ncbi:MAG: hypothetical protein ABIP35_12815, partial [Ginsengibacter sp.]
CYAQVYVGKHFPSDIAAGALLGIITGTILAKVFELTLNSKLNALQSLFSFKRIGILRKQKPSYTIK